MATNPVKTNASLLFTLAKFQVFCSDADDHHTKAATSTTARHLEAESFSEVAYLIYLSVCVIPIILFVKIF